jgi:hypothetical protein
MRIVRVPVWTTLLALLLVAGPVRAGSNGLVLRAIGWYQGEASISEDSITCQVPDTSSAFPDNTFVIGLWNTFGIATSGFPDVLNPFGNPCGGWLQAWNSMRNQGINLQKVVTKYKIARGNRRFGRTGLVPMRRNLPVACRQLRRQKLFLGARLEPNNPLAGSSSSSGTPNVAFVQVFPMYSSDLLSCIRDEFSGLPTDVFSSLPLVAKSKIFGRADNGEKYRSNTIRYTLTLVNSCGNGRIDNFEECDPAITDPGGGTVVQCANNTFCANGSCLNNPTRTCTVNADCVGTCAGQGSRIECTCIY